MSDPFDEAWNIGDYVDSNLLGRAKLLLFVIRINGENYLNAVYLPSSSITQFDLVRHNNMAASGSNALTDHVYHTFLNYDPGAETLYTLACYEYNVTISTANGYQITGVNTSAWSSILFTFPHIYVFYQ